MVFIHCDYITQEDTKNKGKDLIRTDMWDAQGKDGRSLVGARGINVFKCERQMEVEKD
jgi:hypothetical protein